MRKSVLISSVKRAATESAAAERADATIAYLYQSISYTRQAYHFFLDSPHSSKLLCDAIAFSLDEGRDAQLVPQDLRQIIWSCITSSIVYIVDINHQYPLMQGGEESAAICMYFNISVIRSRLMEQVFLSDRRGEIEDLLSSLYGALRTLAAPERAAAARAAARAAAQAAAAELAAAKLAAAHAAAAELAAAKLAARSAARAAAHAAAAERAAAERAAAERAAERAAAELDAAAKRAAAERAAEHAAAADMSFVLRLCSATIFALYVGVPMGLALVDESGLGLDVCLVSTPGCIAAYLTFRLASSQAVLPEGAEEKHSMGSGPRAKSPGSVALFHN
jgi:hypothetical protein